VFAFSGMFRMNGLDQDLDSPSGQLVSGNYHTALGVPAVLGRTLTVDDDDETASPVAVISHRYWDRAFGLDPATVGKTINLGKTVFTIVGITPAGFSGTQDLGASPDFSIPLGMANRISDIGPKFADTMKNQPWLWPLMVMGRLKPGAGFNQVRVELKPSRAVARKAPSNSTRTWLKPAPGFNQVRVELEGAFRATALEGFNSTRTWLKPAPGFNLPMTMSGQSHGWFFIVSANFGPISDIRFAIPSGIEKSGEAPRSCVPENPAGVIPTIVNTVFPRLMVFPTVAGSRPKARSQYRWLITATGEAVSSSSSTVSVRPRTAGTPRAVW